MSAPIVIFAGGGTGGHLYPGLAVAEKLAGLCPDANVVFACSQRPIDRRVLDGEPYAVVPQPVRPMPRGLGGWAGFARACAASWLQARQMLADLRPAAVLGLGGFAAGPIVARAAACGVPAALLNPDAVPGRANRLLARRVDVIFTQFDATAERFAPRLRDKVRAAGCPLRAALTAARRDEAMRHFGLDAARRTLLVNGGSLGAASINDAVAILADDLAALSANWQVLHVTGPSKLDTQPSSPPSPDRKLGTHPSFSPAALANRAAGAAGNGARAFFPLEYCHRMDLAYAAADLAVCRGGAGTVAELAVTATPAVILPYPFHADRQQQLNAARLVGAGGAVVCDDAADAPVNAARLRDVLLPLMADAPRLEEMRRAAASVARGDAAQQVAAWLVEQLAR